MVVNNNLNPEWDEIVYVPVHNFKEKLVLEAMDYQVRNTLRRKASTHL
jgi:Ca2+-dependent lipid-binding protein